MRDFTKNLNDDDLLETRGNREAMMNRPDMDPGMSDDDDDNWGDIGDSNSSDDGWASSFGHSRDDDMDSFGGMSRFGSGMRDMDDFGGMRSGMGGGFGGGFGDRGFGNRGGFSQQYGVPGNNMGQNVQKNPEDAFFDTIAKIGKGCFTFVIDAIKAFQDFDVRQRLLFGRYTCLSSIVLFFIGLLLFILKGIVFGAHLVAASIFAFGIGGCVLLFALDKIKNDELNGVNNEPEDIGYQEPPSEFDTDLDTSMDDNDDTLNLWDTPEDNEKEEEDLDFNSNDGFEGFMESGFDLEDNEKEEPKEADEVIGSLVNTDMMTRQYLFDNMMAVMESEKKNFNSVVELDEDSRQFLGYCNMIETATEVMGGKKAVEAPTVLKIEDGLFFITIILEKPNWLGSQNIDKFVDELVKLCALDPVTHEVDRSITGTGTCVGTKIYIKIMKNENAIVTVKDTFYAVKDEILDPKKEIPVAFGIDSSGKVFVTDFYNVPGLIIAGAPRSGKSWCLKSLIAQMMMFKRPSELNLYLADPKNLTSDYFTMEVPHIKGFTADEFELIKWLDYFCVTEANRRAQILFDAGGFKNVADFKKVHPEVEMPLIYIIVDEVITFTQRMDKETLTRFYKYLKEFVSRLPGYGINIIIVPHLLKNNVIDKNVTDMLPNRIIVKGGRTEIETILDCKSKEFPYKLNNAGDMGLKIGDFLGYVHNTVISKSNSGFDKFFQFLTNFWLKVEPKSFRGSKLQKDLLNGYCKREEYSQITDEEIADIPEDVFNNVNVSVIEETMENRPKRPKIKKDDSLI